jgi:hypothetical protein
VWYHNHCVWCHNHCVWCHNHRVWCHNHCVWCHNHCKSCFVCLMEVGCSQVSSGVYTTHLNLHTYIHI